VVSGDLTATSRRRPPPLTSHHSAQKREIPAAWAIAAGILKGFEVLSCSPSIGDLIIFYLTGVPHDLFRSFLLPRRLSMLPYIL